MRRCSICGEEKIVSESLGVCVDCIRENFDKCLPFIKKAHYRARKKYNLPLEIPQDENGIQCEICGNGCKIGEGEKGYCGIKENRNGRIVGKGIREGNLSFYYDPLPTNCVASWVCAGCSENGYPDYSYTKGAEYGYKNLAVFYHACSFNCLFCQNYHFHNYISSDISISPEELSSYVDEKTSCICYFGGDPGPQIIHSILTSEIALKNKKGKFLRICWETNGNLNKKYLEKMVEISLKSGGCIKFDLKSYDERLNIALCGVSNKKVLENFRFAASFFNERKNPPLIVASTLLVPGYIDEEEIKKISEFIAEINPSIPYSLLVFYPEYYMDDLPITPRQKVFSFYEIAKESGLENVNIGNLHLI
ncbi:MAG: radical SAM protein [Candidatus Omnitrophota bacterium]|nr:MAG: radical SAM protein [Candidatus Omnitrophota bacterium]HDN97608.1 radical SAM protein [bacterium]